MVLPMLTQLLNMMAHRGQLSDDLTASAGQARGGHGTTASAWLLLVIKLMVTLLLIITKHTTELLLQNKLI
jgi:hypothetical protein